MKNIKLISSLIGAAALLLTTSAFAGELTEFEKELSKNIVQKDGKKVKRVSPANFEPASVYAVYYSALWCPPCRAFTPEFVKFYNKAKSDGVDIQVVFASSDRDEDAMEDYITDYDMPWLALNFKNKKMLSQHASRGIPYMAILDRNGKKIWPKDSEWVHPSRGLKKLKELGTESKKKS